MADPEPWLRGPLDDIPTFVAPIFFSFAQVRADLNKFVAGLLDEQVWREVDGASLGFHLKHIAGSVDRLSTYLSEGQLSPEQLRVLKQEHTPDASTAELLQGVNASLSECEARLLTLDASNLFDKRVVGRKLLPTTVIGLLVHIAEHTQRHLGQAITIAKIVRRSG